MTAGATVPRQDERLSLMARYFQVLADPVRLAILERLADGEKHVSGLVAALGMPQGRVSSHLSCLRWCGYVQSQQKGKFVYYRLADERVLVVLRIAQELMGSNAEHLASCTRLAQERLPG